MRLSLICILYGDYEDLNIINCSKKKRNKDQESNIVAIANNIFESNQMTQT